MPMNHEWASTVVLMTNSLAAYELFGSCSTVRCPPPEEERPGGTKENKTLTSH